MAIGDGFFKINFSSLNLSPCGVVWAQSCYFIGSHKKETQFSYKKKVELSEYNGSEGGDDKD